MKLMHCILFTLIFVGCIEKSQQTDNSHLADAINADGEAVDNNEAIGIEKIEYKILPVDESGNDPSLVAFIASLKKIVSNKDTAGLFASLHTAIMVSEGGGIEGIPAFSETWKLDKPETSVLWPMLNRILGMGGTWENGEDPYFCIPYAQSSKAFSQYNYDFDWYFTAVCISPKATVYKEPKAASTELAILSYDIVELDPDFKDADFAKIHTIDKKTQGFVKASDLIYSADQYLVIKKISGKWKIVSFAPFD